MKIIVKIKQTKGANFTLCEPQKLEALNPKELLLYAAAQCAGKTLHAILEKERIKPKSIEIAMSGLLDTDTLEGRSRFKSLNIRYDIECCSISEQTKVGHAVTLTTEKYCGNLAMLRHAAPLSHEVSIVSTEEEVC